MSARAGDIGLRGRQLGAIGEQGLDLADAAQHDWVFGPIFVDEQRIADVPAEDVSNLENASRTTAAAYKYQDADTPAASLIRASHCSVQAVIRNEKLDTFDSGIPCQ